LYCEAEQIPDNLCEEIEEMKMGPKDDPKGRTKRLVEEFGWEK
jgi:elongation factor 2